MLSVSCSVWIHSYLPLADPSHLIQLLLHPFLIRVLRSMSLQSGMLSKSTLLTGLLETMQDILAVGMVRDVESHDLGPVTPHLGDPKKINCEMN